MPDSTSNIDQVAVRASNQETRINELIAAFAPFGTAFGRRPASTTGLVWGFYGVARLYINDTATVKANATVSLTSNGTRYISASRALAVTEQATVFPPAGFAIYKAVTDSSTVTSYEDHRDP